MKLQDVMAALEAMGSKQTRKTMARHGLPPDAFGVKIGDMKKLVREIKVDQALAEQLFATGNADAQYLAGLIADPSHISETVLQHWARTSSWFMVAEYMVAAVAAESPYGYELGQAWIGSDDDRIGSTGWATLNHWVSIHPDEGLDLPGIEALLQAIPTDIKTAGNRTRYTMNGFVIGVGSFVAPLSEQALEVAGRIGEISVDVGDTACKVPLATDYINKVAAMKRIGKKRRQARC